MQKQLCKFVILHVRRTLVNVVLTIALAKVIVMVLVLVTAIKLVVRRWHAIRLARNNLQYRLIDDWDVSSRYILFWYYIICNNIRIVIEYHILIEKSYGFVCAI